MIRLYTWCTPSGVKISIALEELGLDYRVQSWERDRDFRAPAAAAEVHPLGRFPMVEVDGRVLAESGADIVTAESLDEAVEKAVELGINYVDNNIDGECNLCNGGVNFAIDHDPAANRGAMRSALSDEPRGTGTTCT